MRQVTVVEHLLLHQKQVPMATGRFTRLLNELILSAKIISREVNKAGLVDILGYTGDKNVHGEQVTRLDEYAHRVIVHRMQRAGVLCAMASEEHADLIQIPHGLPLGDYFFWYLIPWMGHQILKPMSILEQFSPYIGPKGRELVQKLS